MPPRAAAQVGRGVPAEPSRYARAKIFQRPHTVSATAHRRRFALPVRPETPFPFLRLLRLFAALLLPTLLASPALHAHPVHTSLAEVDYNRATQKLEIALRVFADDFEEALSLRAKKKITLANTPAAEFTTLAQAYLAETFLVRRADGTLAPHTWLGRDHKDAANELWLFFEIALPPSGLDGLRLRHAVLSTQFSDQLNSVLLRDGARSATLAFLPDSSEKPVRLSSPAYPGSSKK